MGKLRNFSGKSICKILARHGFKEVRRRGSNCVMQKKIYDGTITVPVPLHKELRTGTLLSIIRQSSIVRSEFE